jgi:hypothetical protein
MITIQPTPFETTDDIEIEKKLFGINESSGWFTINVIARATDGTTAAWKFEQAVKHTSGGTVLVGNQNTQTAKDTGANQWDVDLIIISNAVGAQIKGKAGTVIKWRIFIELFKSE